MIPWGPANICLRAGDTNHPHYRVWGKTFNVRTGCLTPWLLMLLSLRATTHCPDNHNQGLAFKLSQLFVAAPDHLELLPPSSARINLTNSVPRKILMGHSVFPVSDWVGPICPFVLRPSPSICGPVSFLARKIWNAQNVKCDTCCFRVRQEMISEGFKIKFRTCFMELIDLQLVQVKFTPRSNQWN